jgi:hypothetical protein
MGQARIFRTLGNPDRRFVKHNIYALHDRPDQPDILDILVYNRDPPTRRRHGQILLSTAGEVVQHDDFLNTLADQLVSYVGSNQPCSTRYQCPVVLHSTSPS